MYSRRKVGVAAVLLLVCTVLLVSASYAWLTISTAPEISGIDTNIGANGSLEMALLTGETYKDPSLIRTSIGDSLEVADPVISNQSWGNIIDLSGSNYGLSEISMLPSRLNVTKDAEGQPIVGNNLLIFPRYGEDGRSADFYKDSVSAVYNVDEFTYSTKQQSYGVRAIGTTSKMTVQQAALASARSQVYSYTSAAYRAATSAWKVDGEAFLDIYFRHYYLRTDGYAQADIAVIRDMAVRMRNAINYIDLALRQGVVGIAASMIEDENTFKHIRAELENQSVSLYDTLSNYSEYFEAPGQFSDWAYAIRQDEVTLSDIIRTCDEWATLSDYEFSWNHIAGSLSALMDADKVYWNDNLLSEMEYILSDNVLTMTEDAGPVAHVADFTGDYNVFVTYLNEANIEVKTLTFVDLPYLVQISGILEGLQAASGDEELVGTPIEDIYGFSIDLAFRCNQLTNLLLQTTPETRISGTDDVYEIQGSGSYMRLESEQLDEEKILRVMDAIRVGFIDNQNRLVALAKCVSPNSGDKWVEGYLYLHKFSVTNDGSILMGEPLKLASAIVTLTESIPTILSAVVWMDGDYVDNSLVAISGTSMTGVLNLQFSTSVELNSAFSDDKENQNGGNDEPTPDIPADPAPDIPTEETEFYLEHDGGNQYSFYTLKQDGSREYELTFKGSMDTDAHTVTVNSVTFYPANGVAIPALATYTESNEEYAVSIHGWAPFANLGTEEAAVFFIPIDGEKVSASTALDSLFDTDPGTEFALLDLTGLDTSATTDMSGMFDNCSNLTQLNLSGLDTTNVTNMSRMFEYCDLLTELDLSSFDTANVTDMQWMFCGCENLVKLDLSNFDTSNVTGMFRMFSGCQSLTELDVSSFNTANVRGMSCMFSGCQSLTELDVSGFNTDGLTAVAGMFEYCSSLKELNLSGFNTAKVEQMYEMFEGCSSLTKLDISNFDTSNVYSMAYMFYGCSSLTELDLSSFDTTMLEEPESCLSGCRSLKTIVAPKAVGTVNIYLPGSYVCQSNGNTYTRIDQTVPAQAVLTKSGSNQTPTVVDSGGVTESITWTMYDNGLLRFEGTGAMPNYSNLDDIPWHGYGDEIISVELADGITYLGRGNLGYFDYEQITIPESVSAIAPANGWGGHSKIVHYAGSKQQWDAIAILDPNNTLIAGTITAAKSNAQVLHSGSIMATGISWTLSSDGILAVVGTGAMPDWSEADAAPWTQYSANVKYLVISEGITSVGSYAFDGLANLQSAKIAASVAILGDYAFSECNNLLAVAISEESSLQKIERYCFNNCTNLRSINIPDTVTTLGNSAFSGCAMLDYVTVNGVTNLGDYAFFACESLESITLSEGLTTVPYAAFARCFNLSSATIPSTVVAIEMWAFYGAQDNPFIVHYAGSREQWDLISVDYYNDALASAEVHYGREITVSGSVNDEISWALDDTGVLLISGTGDMPNYEDGVGIQDQDVSPWFYEDYHTVIISDGITSIGDYAFKDAEGLTTITLTTSVTNISWNAFENCDSPIAMYVIGYEDEFAPILGNGYPSNFTFYYLS